MAYPPLDRETGHLVVNGQVGADHHEQIRLIHRGEAGAVVQQAGAKLLLDARQFCRDGNAHLVGRRTGY